MEPKRFLRWWVVLVMAGLFLGLLAIKAVQEGWFEPRLPLDLNNQPALVFFTLSDGCECQMTAVAHAEAQLAAWEYPVERPLRVIRVDINRRPDLAQQYGVARAPALVLLDRNGEVFWMVDEPQSDGKPFDMLEVEEQVAPLFSREGR